MGAEQSSGKLISKDDMSPYMHPIGEAINGQDNEIISGLRSKLPSMTSSMRSGSVSSMHSPTTPSTNQTNNRQNNTNTRFNRAFSTSYTSLPTSHSRDIVIVNDGQGAASDFNYDKHLDILKKIPRVTPLYRSKSLTMSFDHKSAFHFCVRYQEHIRQCADAIVFDQNSLSTRLKEIDSLCNDLDEKIRERHRKQARYLEQIQRFNQTQELATRISSIIGTFDQELNSLNAQLPESSRLEPFSFDPATFLSQTSIADGSSNEQTASSSEITSH